MMSVAVSQHKNFAGGEWADSSGGKTMKVLNPSTGEVAAGALKAARKLQFGTVWINDHVPLVSEMPRGGFKESGYGKDLSVYTLEDYTQIRHVMARID